MCTHICIRSRIRCRLVKNDGDFISRDRSQQYWLGDALQFYSYILKLPYVAYIYIYTNICPAPTATTTITLDLTKSIDISFHFLNFKILQVHFSPQPLRTQHSKVLIY